MIRRGTESLHARAYDHPTKDTRIVLLLPHPLGSFPLRALPNHPLSRARLRLHISHIGAPSRQIVGAHRQPRRADLVPGFHSLDLL